MHVRMRMHMPAYDHVRLVAIEADDARVVTVAPRRHLRGGEGHGRLKLGSYPAGLSPAACTPLRPRTRRPPVHVCA